MGPRAKRGYLTDCFWGPEFGQPARCMIGEPACRMIGEPACRMTGEPAFCCECWCGVPGLLGKGLSDAVESAAGLPATARTETSGSQYSNTNTNTLLDCCLQCGIAST